MNLGSQIEEILDKVYQEGSFEGEHPEIHPDRIAPAVDAILALIEKGLPKKKKEPPTGYSHDYKIGFNQAINLMRSRVRGRRYERW